MNTYKQQLADELNRGERLLWQGTPKQGLMLRKNDFFLIPFSAIWFGFALFWEASVLGAWMIGDAPPPIIFPLFGIPFVVIGLYVLAGRFWHDAWRRKNTYYGLTDDRAIIVNRSGIKSVPLGPHTEIHVKHHGDLRSTISFGPEASMFNASMSNQWGMWTGTPSSPTFEAVSDGRSVYKQVKSVMDFKNQ